MHLSHYYDFAQRIIGLRKWYNHEFPNRLSCSCLAQTLSSILLQELKKNCSPILLMWEHQKTNEGRILFFSKHRCMESRNELIDVGQNSIKQHIQNFGHVQWNIAFLKAVKLTNLILILRIISGFCMNSHLWAVDSNGHISLHRHIMQ